MQRSSPGVFFVRTGRHELVLRALPHPRCPNLRQEVASACIRKHHDGMGWQVIGRTPNTGSPLDPVWLIIFGYQLRPFPHPAALMEPAAHGFCGHLDPVFGLERRREGGTTPPRTAPAIGPWSLCEYGPQSAREPGHDKRR